MYFWSHFPNNLLEVVLAGLVGGREGLIYFRKEIDILRFFS